MMHGQKNFRHLIVTVPANNAEEKSEVYYCLINF